MKQNTALLKRVEEYRYKNGVYVLDEKSKAYLGFKLVTVLAFIWVFVINILFIGGQLMEHYGNEYVTVDLVPVISAAVATAAILAGFVLALLKKHYAALPIVVTATVFCFILFLGLQTDVGVTLGVTESFYYRHAIPLILLFIGIIGMGVIGIRARMLLKRDCKVVLDKLYITFKEKNPEHTEEQWQEFLQAQGINPAEVK